MTYLFIGLAVLFNTAASIALKKGMKGVQSGTSLDALASMLLSPTIWIAVFSYFATFCFFSLALRGSSLNVVQPVITGGTIALVCACAALFLDEEVTIRVFAGIMLVLAGSALLLIKQ